MVKICLMACYKVVELFCIMPYFCLTIKKVAKACTKELYETRECGLYHVVQ